MTLSELYRLCRKELSGETADFDLSQLFRAYFSDAPGLCFSEKPVDERDAFIFRQRVRRLAEGYPLQYLLGEWEFYGIPLKVGEGVLIPQPDTETLVDVALELAATLDAPRIADYCAGSGAIALALAAHLPTATLCAVELSEEALGYLRQNVAESPNSSRIEVIEGDVTGPLHLPPLDLIVSNPPYLTPEELESAPPQVRHEPPMALLGGEDGLDFYREIAKNALTALKEGGWLIFESGWKQADAIAAILRGAGFTDVSMRRDLCGVQRCVYAKKPKRRTTDGAGKD